MELLEALVLRPTLPDAQQCSPGNGSQAEHSSLSLAADANRIIDGGTEYTRATHPTLFKVIDLLEQNEHARNLSVRQLAQQTGVSKSWCAIAKRHALRLEAVH
jgi:AraC-like DNA-binding protein